MKVKDKYIGSTTYSNTLSTVLRIDKTHANLLYNEGRFEMLDGVTDEVMKPLEDRTAKDLREMAKDMDGFKKNLSKAKLIELIQNAAS